MYKLKTDIFEDGKIMQEVTYDHEGLVMKVLREVVDTRERHIEKALIGLGWTPPNRKGIKWE